MEEESLLTTAQNSEHRQAPLFKRMGTHFPKSKQLDMAALKRKINKKPPVAKITVDALGGSPKKN